MRRFLPPPAFIVGVYVAMTISILLSGILSYQSDHCDPPGHEGHLASRMDDRASAPRNEDEEKEWEVTEYARDHPLACGVVGVVGLVPFTVGYMDHHEGFFVGAFTLALFCATIFLWRSTEKLYQAGERQIEISRSALISTQRAWIKVKSAEIGNGIEYDEFGDLHASISIDYENIGNAPALNVQMWGGLYVNKKGETTWRERLAAKSKEIPSGGVTIFPGESLLEIAGRERNDLPLRAIKFDLDEALSETVFEGMIFLKIIGAIFYTLPSDPSKFCTTNFHYLIYKEKIFGSDINIRPAEGDIEAVQLKLHRSTILGSDTAT